MKSKDQRGYQRMTACGLVAFSVLLVVKNNLMRYEHLP